MTLNMPVYFTLIDTKPMIQNAASTLSIQFFCGFQGVLTCPQLKIVWSSTEPRGNTSFIAKNFQLCNGAIANLPGAFEHASVYVARQMTIITPSRLGTLRTFLPPNSMTIRVLPQPPPLSVAVDVPRFLLPNHWQIALVSLNVAREITQLDVKISGLAYKPGPLRVNGKVFSEKGDRLSFSKLVPGEYELSLPIKPRISGSLRIEALMGGPSVVREVPFTVSDFLKMKLVCRVASRVAQLTARVTSDVSIEISDVKFTGADREEIGCRSIGLPACLVHTNVSALFILDADPDSALIFVRQRGLSPFSLFLKIKRLEEGVDYKHIGDENAPLSILVPASFTL
jgi:hypothetical protein